MLNLLIVEDSDLVVDKLNKLLEPLDNINIIGRAEDEDSALRLINEYKPDLLILDISLKKGTGINVLQSIRNLTIKPYIIILSNLSYGSYKEKCFNLGANHFFDKALEFEKVYETLEKFPGSIGEKPNDNQS